MGIRVLPISFRIKHFPSWKLLLLWILVPYLTSFPGFSETTPSISPESPEETLLWDSIQNLTWPPTHENTQKIRLNDIIRAVEKHNTDVLLGREKISETEAKREDVEMKRVLFFFKYFDAAFLEGSAESDVLAAGAHVQALLNHALLDAVNRYYDLTQATMTQYIAFQTISQGKSLLLFNENRFLLGETTNIDVLQTKVQLLKHYQDYLKASTAYKIASYRLRDLLKEISKNGTLFDQEDLILTPETISIPVFHYFSSEDPQAPNYLNSSLACKMAMEHRPDLKELKFRRISLEQLHKTSSIKIDRVQHKILLSTLKQMALKHQKMEQEIEILVQKDFEEYLLSKKAMALSQAQFRLAKKVLNQVQISHQEGFSSNKDVLDAQVAEAQAHVSYTDTLIHYNKSQIQLLYDMGIITADGLIQGKVEL